MNLSTCKLFFKIKTVTNLARIIIKIRKNEIVILVVIYENLVTWQEQKLGESMVQLHTPTTNAIVMFDV